MGNQPTDHWKPVGTTPIKVDIDGLQDFVKALTDEWNNEFKVNLQQGVVPMLQAVPPFGGGQLSEGKFFSQEYGDCVQAVGGLLGDVGMGLQALSSAAGSVYAEYVSGDALSAATVDNVLNAFDPPPGTTTLQQALKKQEDAGSDSSDGTTKDGAPKVPQLGDHPAAPPHYDPGAEQKIAAGTAGAYTIPADSDHMSQAPAEPITKPPR